VTKPYSEQLDDMDGQPWRSVLLPTPPTPSHTDTSVSTVQHCLLSRTFSLHQTTDNGCRAFIFPLVLSRCDTSINLKAKVPGEFEVKLRPTQAGKRSFLQPPKDKTETPILPHTHTHTHTHTHPTMNFSSIVILWSASCQSLRTPQVPRQKTGDF
jgi:hypothetical protein